MKKNVKPLDKIKLEDSGLTVLQERAAVAIAAGKRISDIVNELGVPSRTLYDWLKIPEFISHYKRLQKDVVLEIRGQLSTLADKAIGTLKMLMESGGEQSRLKAACYILDHLTNEQREALKARIKKQRNGKE